MINDVLENRAAIFEQLLGKKKYLLSWSLGKILFNSSKDYWLNKSVSILGEVDCLFEDFKAYIINDFQIENSFESRIEALEKYDDGSVESVIAMDSLSILKTIFYSLSDKAELNEVLSIYIDSVDYYIQDDLNVQGYGNEIEEKILNHRTMKKNELIINDLISFVESIKDVDFKSFDEMEFNYLIESFI